MSLRVNGELIAEDDIRVGIAALRRAVQRVGGELGLEERIALREQTIATLVEIRLIFQEAGRLGLMPSETEIAEAAEALVPRSGGMPGCRTENAAGIVSKEAARRLIFRRMVAHWSSVVKRPSESSVKDFYRQNPGKFEHPEMVHVMHIARDHEPGQGRPVEVTNQALLESLRQRIVAGEDFAMYAAEYSDCPENSGDLGFFPRGVMVEEFDAVVFNAPQGVVTPPFETRLAWHIALVREHRAPGRISLRDAAPRIEEALHRAAMDQEVGSQLAALHAKAVITR